MVYIFQIIVNIERLKCQQKHVFCGKLWKAPSIDFGVNRHGSRTASIRALMFGRTLGYDAGNQPVIELLYCFAGLMRTCSTVPIAQLWQKTRIGASGVTRTTGTLRFPPGLWAEMVSNVGIVLAPLSLPGFRQI